jgi:hypothetical protein
MIMVMISDFSIVEIVRLTHGIFYERVARYVHGHWARSLRKAADLEK